MSFWSSQCIKDKQRESENSEPKLLLIHPYDEKNVKHAAYELELGEDFLITPDESAQGLLLADKKALKIPPGQFALLSTKECVNIPRNVIAFISLKGSVKFKGLINISGFQVDPGFPGHLKFSVYNASNEDVHLNFDEPCFLIWFADLKAKNEPYDGDHKDQKGFTPDDRDRMSESHHSAENLHKRLIEAEKKVDSIMAVGLVIVIPLLIGLVVAVFDRWFGDKADQIGNGGLIVDTALIVGVSFIFFNLLFNRLFSRLINLIIRFFQWLKKKN